MRPKGIRASTGRRELEDQVSRDQSGSERMRRGGSRRCLGFNPASAMINQNCSICRCRFSCVQHKTL
jgi:hypothetical protein